MSIYSVEDPAAEGGQKVSDSILFSLDFSYSQRHIDKKYYEDPSSSSSAEFLDRYFFSLGGLRLVKYNFWGVSHFPFDILGTQILSFK